MAFGNGVVTRASFMVRRANASTSFVLRGEDDNKRESLNENTSQRGGSGLMEKRCFGSVGERPQWRSLNSLYVGASAGLDFYRHMSTGYGESSDKAEYLSDVAEIISDKTVEVVTSQAPVENEVAIAAADSFAPVAALQHLIGAVHQVTGFNCC